MILYCPRAFLELNNCTREKIQHQFELMNDAIKIAMGKIRVLTENEQRRKINVSNHKYDVLSRKRVKQPRLITNEDDSQAVQIGLAIDAVVSGGYAQKMKDTENFIRVAWGGQLWKKIHDSIIEEIKFPAVEIAKQIDIGGGSMNLTCIGEIRKMQPGLGFNERGMIPSAPTVQHRQKKVTRYGMAHLEGSLSELHRHLF